MIMSKKKTADWYLTLLVLLPLILSCSRQRNDPGRDYFPDMYLSTAYETYSENPNFTDGKTMRSPAPGTVPRDFMPFDYSPDPESRAKAGAELVNPYRAYADNIETGKKEFDTFCTVCHGFSGVGDGRIFKLGLYPMKPRPLSGPDARVLKDGEVYHTITLGFGSMGAYGSQIRPDDRWKIVLYIRQLNGAVVESAPQGK
jgi:mono/diheme cytochrome c family protein